PFSADAVLPITEHEKHFSFELFKIPFKTYLGKDFFDKRVLLQRIIAGSVKLCASSIVIQKNKIFLLASLRMEKEQADVKENVIAEAALSAEYPISVTINKSKYHIGTREEFLYRRLAIQSARQRAQKIARFNR